MKRGDLAYAKPDKGKWTTENSWIQQDPIFLGLIIEVKDLMVSVLNNGNISWYGKPGIQVDVN